MARDPGGPLRPLTTKRQQWRGIVDRREAHGNRALGSSDPAGCSLQRCPKSPSRGCRKATQGTPQGSRRAPKEPSSRPGRVCWGRRTTGPRVAERRPRTRRTLRLAPCPARETARARKPSTKSNMRCQCESDTPTERRRGIAEFQAVARDLLGDSVARGRAAPQTPEEAEDSLFRFAESILSLACPDPTACNNEHCRRQRICRHFARVRASGPPARARIRGARPVRRPAAMRFGCS